MIEGTVNADLEAIISLAVAGESPGQRPIEAVIDTGFSGYVTLPPSIIEELGLTWLGREQGTLADGSVEPFDVFRAKVLWNGQYRAIEVEAVNTQPLLGMALLARHSLEIEVVDGGAVRIAALR